MTANTFEEQCGNSCPCDKVCPLGKALDIIGGKWKLPIICSLVRDGSTRYNELKRKIEGISNTMLASSLRELEDAGLILRVQYNEMPLRVEYSVSDACDTLIPILVQLAQWGRDSATASKRDPQSSER